MNLEVYIKEFEKLKDEQIEHIRLRDKLLYYTALLYGSVFSIILTHNSTYPLLLILPFASFIIGSMYLTSEQKISNIGIYIRKTLSTNFPSSNPDAEAIRIMSPPFGWEQFVIDRGVRFVQKCLKYIVYTILYIGSGLIALFLYLMERGSAEAGKLYGDFPDIGTAIAVLRDWEIVVIVADLILIGFLLIEMAILGFSSIRSKLEKEGDAALDEPEDVRNGAEAADMLQPGE